MQPEIFFQIIVIVYSVILHEIAHGYAALLFGDKTALYNDRLTLNPIPHIDIYGSIIIPGLLLLSGSSILAGWAKPVPVSEHNLVPFKLGSFTVSIAGVLTNFLLCVIFSLVGHYSSGETVKNLCSMVAVVNLGLAIFNLIPIPPADGYRIISLFLPWNIKRKIEGFIFQNFLVTILLAIFIATQVFTWIFPFFYRIVVNFIH